MSPTPASPASGSTPIPPPTATITLVGGIDTGNGYTKATIRDADQTCPLLTRDLPSAVMAISSGTPKVPRLDDSAVETLADNFVNQLDATFQSPLVARSDRRIFGRRALAIPGSRFSEFAITGERSKADQELSTVLVLGLFAEAALQVYVHRHGALPDQQLQVDVYAGLALPIAEYVQRRSAFATAFTGRASDRLAHTVTVNNFDTRVSVNLRFRAVRVLPEGASAQFAIIQYGAPLVDRMLADLRRADERAFPGLDGETLVGYRNTVGVDVGEGTTNFPVFTDGAFSDEASTTLPEGFGTTLSAARDRLVSEGHLVNLRNRKQLADLLLREPSAVLAERHAVARATVDDEAVYLVADIADAFTEVLTAAGEATEVVYVFGGGAGPIRHLLHPVLIERAPGVPVLYLDARYGRDLNREGLMIGAENAFAADRASAAPPRADQKKKDT